VAVAFPGIRLQTDLDDLLDFSGTITAGGTAQLLLPQQPGRLYLAITNNSATDSLYLGIGPAKATASLAAGAVSAIAVNNGGVGYTVAPQVVLLGGVIAGDYVTAPGSVGKQPGVQYPGTPAQAHATIAGGAVTGIVIDNPGSGYVVPPTVYLENPWPQLGGGAFAPSATNGIAVPTGQTFTFNGSLLVPGSAIAIFGATTADAFHCMVGGLW
jgi:hypothetical protein